MKIFCICHRCRWHRWQTLSCEYLREFSKKFRYDPNGIFRGMGETDSWKKPEVENLMTVPLISNFFAWPSFFVGSGTKMTWKGMFQIGINHFGFTTQTLHLIWSERCIFLPDVQLPIIGKDQYFIQVYSLPGTDLLGWYEDKAFTTLLLQYMLVKSYTVPRWYFCFYHFVIIICIMLVTSYTLFLPFFREWRTGILWNILTTILIDQNFRWNI